jgi:pyruvate,water dikinase
MLFHHLTDGALGDDHDSQQLAALFKELYPVVTRLFLSVILSAYKSDRKVGICGQALSDHPELVRFLVEDVIDSISASPPASCR